MYAKRIVLLGPPGAGKGTHGERLTEKLGVPHIATGAMLRHIIETEDSDLARAARTIEQGNLVPDSVMNPILFREIEKPESANGFILDGFPRTVPQAEALDAELGQRSLSLDVAIALDVDEATILSRLAGRLTCPNCGATYHQTNEPPKKAGICDRCGHALVVREDDRPDHVKVRLGLYHERTEPLLRFYADSGRLKRVAAGESEDIVFPRILEALKTA